MFLVECAQNTDEHNESLRGLWLQRLLCYTIITHPLLFSLTIDQALDSQIMSQITTKTSTTKTIH